MKAKIFIKILAVCYLPIFICGVVIWLVGILIKSIGLLIMLEPKDAVREFNPIMRKSSRI